MKFFGLFVIAVCLGTSSAGFFNPVSLAKNTVSAATNVAKGTVNAATSAAKSTASAATNVVTSTVNTATDAAQKATNMAVDAAQSAVKAVSTGTVNMGIKVFLAQVQAMVKATGNRNVDIPDVGTGMGPIKFNATGGFFGDISSLRQAGEANVTTNGTSILIDISVKLDKIETGYNNFTVSMWKLKAGGGIKIYIANDTFVIHLRLKPGINCALNVEKVDVTEFDGIEIDFINMGSKSEWVLEKASNMIVKFLKGIIKKQVQSAIDTNLKKALKENGSICSKFLG